MHHTGADRQEGLEAVPASETRTVTGIIATALDLSGIFMPKRSFNAIPGNSRDLANRCVLLLLVALVTASCSGEDKSDSNSRLAGTYVWWHEVHTFTPCGSRETYWIDAAEQTIVTLREHYEAAVTEPYQALHIEIMGHFLDETRDGFAADYDRLIFINEILEMDSAIPASCGSGPVAEAASPRRCYRNVQPFEDNPGHEDVLSLTVVVVESRAMGDYNWLPAFKDPRLGTFEGNFDGPVISANYKFTQEGRSQTAQIRIRLEPGQAVVEGGLPELGLNATIGQVDCSTGETIGPNRK